MQNINMTTEQCERFVKFAFGDDSDFYREYTSNLSEAKRHIFFKENPDFMSNLHIECDEMCVLKDRMYKSVWEKIKEYEGGKDNAKMLYMWSENRCAGGGQI